MAYGCTRVREHAGKITNLNIIARFGLDCDIAIQSRTITFDGDIETYNDIQDCMFRRSTVLDLSQRHSYCAAITSCAADKAASVAPAVVAANGFVAGVHQVFAMWRSHQSLANDSSW